MYIVRTNGIVRYGTVILKREGRGENYGGEKPDREKKDKRARIQNLRWLRGI